MKQKNSFRWTRKMSSPSCFLIRQIQNQTRWGSGYDGHQLVPDDKNYITIHTIILWCTIHRPNDKRSASLPESNEFAIQTLTFGRQHLWQSRYRKCPLVLVKTGSGYIGLPAFCVYRFECIRASWVTLGLWKWQSKQSETSWPQLPLEQNLYRLPYGKEFIYCG